MARIYDATESGNNIIMSKHYSDEDSEFIDEEIDDEDDEATPLDNERYNMSLRRRIEMLEEAKRLRDELDELDVLQYPTD